MITQLFWLLAAQSAAATPSVYSPDTQRFGDWTVVCDNLQRCTALGLASSAQRAAGQSALLIITKEPSSRIDAKVVLLEEGETEKPSANASWALPALGVGLVPERDTVRKACVAQGGETLARYAALPHAASEMLVISRADAAPVELSLNGATEAFDWMNGMLAQHYDVKPSLVRLVKPPEAQPPLGTPPRELIALSTKLTDLEVCAGMGSSAQGAIRPEGWLDGKRKLWSISCTPPGGRGRNSSSVLVITEKARAMRFALADMTIDRDPWATPEQVMAGDDAPTPVASEAEFEPRTGILTLTDASPGLDSYSEYVAQYGWTGRTFVLIRATQYEVQAADGDGNAMPYKAFWPPSYRAAVKP